MDQSIIEVASQTVEAEGKSVLGLIPFLNSDFEKAVHLVFHSKGRLVISGIGKSALIAQKIVASLNSTGTPAIFLHAADAIHGDIGMVQQEDAVMIISKSGESPEIKMLAPVVKNFKNPLIAMCGNMASFLATTADIVLNTTVAAEACPNNLAPTSSTTAQMVMGDALTVCLMKLRGFSVKDFAKFHPGGSLGKRLYLRVADLFTRNEKPQVPEDCVLQDIIIEMTKNRLGATVVLDKKGQLTGIITDGDLRRMLQNNLYSSEITAKEIMTVNPKTIEPDDLAVNALDKMRTFNITQLIVAAGTQYKGIIHLHDIIREGII